MERFNFYLDEPAVAGATPLKRLPRRIRDIVGATPDAFHQLHGNLPLPVNGAGDALQSAEPSSHGSRSHFVTEPLSSVTRTIAGYHKTNRP